MENCIRTKCFYELLNLRILSDRPRLISVKLRKLYRLSRLHQTFLYRTRSTRNNLSRAQVSDARSREIIMTAGENRPFLALFPELSIQILRQFFFFKHTKHSWLNTIPAKKLCNRYKKTRPHSIIEDIRYYDTILTTIIVTKIIYDCQQKIIIIIKGKYNSHRLESRIYRII